MAPAPTHRLLGAALDVLAPPRCLGCRRLAEGTAELGLCPRCRGQIGPPSVTADGRAGVDLLVAATAYRGPALGIVGALKRSGLPAAAATAAELLCESAGPPAGGAMLVPVPATRLRRLTRRIDPAAVLAGELARRLGIALLPCLRRVDHGRQRGRPRSERLARPPRFRGAASPPAHAVLVDDVLTTGATLQSCAQALRAGGSSRVEALVFARAVPSRAPT